MTCRFGGMIWPHILYNSKREARLCGAAALVVGCILGACLATSARGLQVVPATVQQDRPWWVTGEFGEGQLKLNSDQQQGNRTATFAMGFAGGRRLGDWARVGLHLNGWLLQGFNLQRSGGGRKREQCRRRVRFLSIPEEPVVRAGRRGLVIIHEQQADWNKRQRPGLGSGRRI